MEAAPKKEVNKMFIEVGVGRLWLMTELEDYKNSRARRHIGKKVRRVMKEMNRLTKEVNECKVENDDCCRYCGSSLTIKWGRYKRKVRYFLAKARRILVQRFRCLSCKRTFSFLPEFLMRFRRFAKKALRDIVDAKLSFGSGNRNTGHWSRGYSISHTTLLKELEVVGEKCKDALKAMVDHFSGVMCVDDIWIKKGRGKYIYGLCAVDGKTERVLWVTAYLIDSDQGYTKDDGVRIAVEDLSQVILPETVKFYVTDDDSTLHSTLSDYYPDAKHQLCIFHVKKNIYKKLTPRAKHLKLSSESLQLIKNIMAVFDASTEEEGVSVLSELYKARNDYGLKMRKVLKSLWRNRDKLFHYIENDIPRTNNAAEHFFSEVAPIKKLCKSFRGIKGLRGVLTAKALHYNFRRRYESKDGLTPNERAGITTKMSMYDYIGYPC